MTPGRFYRVYGSMRAASLIVDPEGGGECAKRRTDRQALDSWPDVIEELSGGAAVVLADRLEIVAKRGAGT
jgi:hypothetical protein